MTKLSILPPVVIAASALLSLSVLESGFFYSGLNSLPLFSLVNEAWADGSNNGPPSWCPTPGFVKIGNMIRGFGCIIGTDDADFIQAVPNIPITDPLVIPPSTTADPLDNLIFGEDKPDIIFSDVGIDTVYGGDGGDTVQGGPGNDQIFGQDGNDNLFGGFEDDLVVGGKGSDHMFGDVGNDILAGGPGADYFDCGDGYDMIIDFKLEQGDITAGNCEVF